VPSLFLADDDASLEAEEEEVYTEADRKVVDDV
jgi:hypothetical protein